MKPSTRAPAILLGVILTACSPGTADTTPGAFSALPDAGDAAFSQVLEAGAAEVCDAAVWTGIAEPLSFPTQAAAREVEPESLVAAVRRHCPELVYEPLSRAEVDWCGTGNSFGKNFFLVVQAGVDLGLASFTVVEPGLLVKAADGGSGFSDYEIELLTAELQTMSESSRFERDWAEACRSTF